MDIKKLLEPHEKPLIISHRGGSLIAKENTLSAYKKSIELKVDIVETDVRMTKDGFIVCFHDKTLDRIAEVKGELKNLTLKELKKINSDIPTLEELLDFCNSKVSVIIEVKEIGFEEKLIEIIERKNAIKEIIVISFEEEIVKRIKILKPAIETGNLMKVDLPAIYKLSAKHQADNLVEKTLKLGAKVLVLNYSAFSEEILNRCHEHNITLWLWTVNDIDNMRKFVELKVDGIATDSPDKLIKIVSEFGT